MRTTRRDSDSRDYQFEITLKLVVKNAAQTHRAAFVFAICTAGYFAVAISIASTPPFFLSSVLYFNVTFSIVFIP